MPRRRYRRYRRPLLLNPRRRRWLAITAVSLLALVAAWLGVRAWNAPDIVVRVLFAETAGCSHEERMLVVGVMHNRVRNPPFGNLATIREVVLQPGAFSCIGDSSNHNWARSRIPDLFTPAERAAWKDCQAILALEKIRAVGPSGRPLVYYHDKSIGMPSTWDNAGWRAVREVTTEHFIFYSILPASRGK